MCRQNDQRLFHSIALAGNAHQQRINGERLQHLCTLAPALNQPIEQFLIFLGIAQSNPGQLDRPVRRLHCVARWLLFEPVEKCLTSFPERGPRGIAASVQGTCFNGIDCDGGNLIYRQQKATTLTWVIPDSLFQRNQSFTDANIENGFVGEAQAEQVSGNPLCLLLNKRLLLRESHHCLKPPKGKRGNEAAVFACAFYLLICPAFHKEFVAAIEDNFVLCIGQLIARRIKGSNAHTHRASRYFAFLYVKLDGDAASICRHTWNLWLDEIAVFGKLVVVIGRQDAYTPTAQILRLRRFAGPFDNHRLSGSAYGKQAAVCSIWLHQAAVPFDDPLPVDKGLYFHRAHIAAVSTGKYPAVKGQCAFSGKFARPG